MNSPLQFGLVGCGRVAQELHLPAWRTIPGARLVAICDTSQSSMDAISRLHPEARRYTSLDDFLTDSPGLSFVDLATPGRTHPEIAGKILRSGINLLCEKPLALSANEARTLYEAAARTGSVLTCIHNYRFKENTHRALKILQSHRLGDIVAVNLKFRSGPLFDENASWRRSERESRTLLFDSGIHLVDIALLFLGPVTSIRFVDADVDRAGLQRVIFGTVHENGARGVFDLMIDASCSSTEIEILGESAGLSLQFYPNGLRLLPHRDDPLCRLLGEGRRLFNFVADSFVERLSRNGRSRRAQSHARLFEAFIETLVSQRANPVPPDEVLRTIDLLDNVAMRAYPASGTGLVSLQNGAAQVVRES
jgi:predicted dehydrogenase